MAGKYFRTQQVMLHNVKPSWVTLDKPDTKYNDAGTYGIGVLLDEESADLLTTTARELIGDAEDEITPPVYQAGDVLKATMKASYRNKRTGVLSTEKPQIYGPGLEPLSGDDVLKIGKRSVINLNATLKPYLPIAPGASSGVSVRLAAVQVVAFDVEPTAEEFGFTPTAMYDGPQQTDFPIESF